MEQRVVKVVVEQAERVALKGDTNAPQAVAEANLAGEGDFANKGARRENNW